MVVYKIENKINGKIYVGQTIKDINVRVKEHFNNSRSFIGRALRKYGIESFSIMTIDSSKSNEILSEKEQYWIKFFDCKSPKGYNLTDGGEGLINPSLGVRVQISRNNASRRSEVRKKISLAHKGKKLSEEHKAKIKASVLLSDRKGRPKGKEFSSEHREKISQSLGRPAHNKGLSHSEKTKRKMSESHTGRVSPMKGKHHSEEAKRRISESGTGIKRSEDFKKRQSQAKLEYTWNKGLTKNDHPSIMAQSKKVTGLPAWNKGLTKETDERVRSYAKSLSSFSALGVFKKGWPPWNKGAATIQ